MAAGLERVVQQNFSAGMFRSVAPELIPENGAWDITNGLLAEDGAIFKRGGTTYRSTSALAGPILMVWDGWLNTGGQQTIIARDGQFAKVADDGTVTSIGGAGVTVPTRPAVLGGVMYFPGGVTYNGASIGSLSTVGTSYAVAGNRLWVATGARALFSGIWDGVSAPTFAATDFHELPGGVNILGMQPLRDALAVFSTDGIWVISNIGMDLTDDLGNVQHRLDQYARDIVLWADAGIAGWAGGLIVPAVDAIWNVSLGVTSEAPQPFGRISDPIQTLYREYVRLGYRPGAATVYRGHYLLPILSGVEPVDLLVCKLDTHAWSHLSGYGGKVAAVGTKISPATRKPILMGGAPSGRLLNLAYFEPDLTVDEDADGNAFSWSLTTRDFMTGRMVPNTVTKLRATYDLESQVVATIEAFFVESRIVTQGSLWGAFKWGTGKWTAGGVEQVALEPVGSLAPEDATGAHPFSWQIGRKTRYARFRLRSEQASTRLSLRALEVFVRSNGRI